MSASGADEGAPGRGEEERVLEKEAIGFGICGYCYCGRGERISKMLGDWDPYVWSYLPTCPATFFSHALSIKQTVLYTKDTTR